MALTPAHRIVELLGAWRSSGAPVGVRPARGTGVAVDRPPRRARSAGEATRERLARALRALILDGRIPVQTRLPAERTLAVALGVSRATVTGAYDRLREQGYVESRQGAGSWVTLPGGSRAAPSDAIVGGSGLDMRIAALPAPAVLEDLFAAAAAELPAWLDHTGYDPLGLPPLRQAIAARFECRGLPTRAEQVLVTNGALHALDLAIRAMLPPGRTALVELPSYPAALDALRDARAHMVPVAISEDGWDITGLEETARERSPALAYLMPDFHNPTGRVMDADVRRRVLRALASAGAVVVIDETFVELNVDGIALPAPAASFTRGAEAAARTITIGSLSKPVWGGLRIGWARAEPALIHRMASVRAASDMSSPLFEQIVAAHTLERLDEILAERREVIRTRRAALMRALDHRLPDWRYTAPPGGLFIWVELPEPVSTSLSLEAGARGLRLTPGPRFAAAGLLERHLRLPFTLPPGQLERAVEILAALEPRRAAAVERRLEYVA